MAPTNPLPKTEAKTKSPPTSRTDTPDNDRRRRKLAKATKKTTGGGARGRELVPILSKPSEGPTSRSKEWHRSTKESSNDRENNNDKEGGDTEDIGPKGGRRKEKEDFGKDRTNSLPRKRKGKRQLRAANWIGKEREYQYQID